jgi:hypothetical protein
MPTWKARIYWCCMGKRKGVFLAEASAFLMQCRCVGTALEEKKPPEGGLIRQAMISLVETLPYQVAA